MTSLSIAVRIWARTLFVGAFLWSTGCMLAGEFFAAFICVIFLVAAFFVTLPLLMLITPLVRVSAWLPYNIQAKTAWLTFWLALLIFLLYVWVSGFKILGNDLFTLNLILVSLLAGLLFAVITTRKRLRELYSAA